MRQLDTVERKIHAVVDSMKEDVAYLFMNWAQANVAISQIEKPTIVYVLPPSGNMKFTYARVYDHPETQIGFLAPTEFDFEGDKNDGIIEAMKRLAVKFVNKLNESEYFECIEGSVPYQVVYDYLDQNTTGVIITLKLEEVDGISICDDSYSRKMKSTFTDEYDDTYTKVKDK